MYVLSCKTDPLHYMYNLHFRLVAMKSKFVIGLVNKHNKLYIFITTSFMTIVDTIGDFFSFNEPF